MRRLTSLQRTLAAALSALLLVQSLPLTALAQFRTGPAPAGAAAPLIAPAILGDFKAQALSLNQADLAGSLKSIGIAAGLPPETAQAQAAKVLLGLLAKPGTAALAREQVSQAAGTEAADALVSAARRIHGEAPSAGAALDDLSARVGFDTDAGRALERAFSNARAASPVHAPVRYGVSDDYFENLGKKNPYRQDYRHEDEPGEEEAPEDEPADEDEAADGDEAAAQEDEDEDQEEKAEAVENGADEAVKKIFRLRDTVQKEARQILKGHLGGDVGDGKLHRDLNRIMARLTKAAGLPKEAAQVFVGNSMLPNAFTTILNTEAHYLKNNASVAKAFRVSSIFVSLGLLRAVESEDQLAFVLAHELMHNLKGHLKDPSGMGHMTLGHFHELEADAEGLKLLAAAGYKPEAAVDSLYSLNKEMDRLEKQYSALGQDKSEMAQALGRLRDVHPHHDIRRANMLDFMDEAKEGFKPGVPVAAVPVWMQRRDSAVRPTAIDRFAKRMHDSIELPTVAQGIRNIELFIRRENAKRTLDYERWAIVEEAYRDLVKKVKAHDELRAIELSIYRQQNRMFPSRRLRAALITRQLDMLLTGLGRRPTMADLLNGPASMSVETRQAGSLRILGGIKTRAELEDAYKALNGAAESLGLDLNRDSGRKGSQWVREQVAARLWNAASKALTAELGRPARPEEIMDELEAKLNPAWRVQYNWGFGLMIMESVFGPEAARSKLLPSQLLRRLQDIPEPRPEKDLAFNLVPAGPELFARWELKHHRPPNMNPGGRKLAFNYERFYLKGLSSPSKRDQMDLFSKFTQGFMPASFIRILRRDGQLEGFLRASVQALNRALEGDLDDEEEAQEGRLDPTTYKALVNGLLYSALEGLKEVEPIRATVALIWSEVRPVAARKGPKAVLKRKEQRTALADTFFGALNFAMRRAVVQVNLAGQRPKPEEMRKVAELTGDIEGLLRNHSRLDLAQRYARLLADNLADDRDYMEAYKLALPGVVIRTARYDRAREFVYNHFSWEWLENLLLRLIDKVEETHEGLYERVAKWRGKRRALEGLPKEARVSLSNLDFSTFLALAGDDTLDPKVRLMAAALLDRLDLQGRQADQKDSLGRVIGLAASAAIGRWLIEDAVRLAPEAGLPALVKDLLRLNDLHPGLHQPDLAVAGTTGNAFREGAVFVKRSEPYRSLAKAEHPFRGVAARWANHLGERLDAAKAWPELTEDKLDLMDFMNSNGEFSEALDHRIVALAESDEAGFRRWIKRDKKRNATFTADGDLESISINTVVGNVPGVPVPKVQPLRIVRNPALRVRLFDFLPEGKLGERAPPQSLRERYRAWKRLYRAYTAARKWFSKDFLDQMQHEGSMEDKVFVILEEVDRIATAEAAQAKKDWNKGKRHSREEELGWSESDSKLHQLRWKHYLPHEKKQVLAGYRNDMKARMQALLLELYNAFASTQDPVLGVILDNYPEPTRSRDGLVERLMKARALTPAQLQFLESHKSYRQPNPLRIIEKHLLDQAVIQMRKFSPVEKVDILLHLAGIERLPKERIKVFDNRILSGDRKKLARDMASIRSIGHLENYMTLMHPKDRGLLVRALFYGEDPLSRHPEQVQRLYEKIVIEGRNLPAFMEKVFRAYYRILTDDERAKLLSDLAALEDVKSGLKGPEIVKVALRGMGVSGAKVAQVLATHKGLVDKEYADPLEQFKDRAQDLNKVRVHDLVQQRLAEIGAVSAAAGDGAVPADDRLDALSREALPKAQPAYRLRLLKQVAYLLKAQGRKVRWVEEMGRELGAGSIKVVYKVGLDDGRVWVVKTRSPGAAYKTTREFQILEGLIGELEGDGTIKTPGARQLLDEVKSLVQAEMDFRDEADKQTAMRERAAERPWYARWLAGAAPKVSAPHPVYIGEQIMVEEYMQTTRFADLPEWTLLDREALGRAARGLRAASAAAARFATESQVRAAFFHGAAASVSGSVRRMGGRVSRLGDRMLDAAATAALALKAAPGAAWRGVKVAVSDLAQSAVERWEEFLERMSARAERTADRYRAMKKKVGAVLRAPKAVWDGMGDGMKIAGSLVRDTFGVPAPLRAVGAAMRYVAGPSKASIARRTVREGMLEIVLHGRLEPDPHTGNRHARAGAFWKLKPGLVVLDIGQEVAVPLERLRPLVLAGLALDAGDAAAASKALLGVVKIPEHRTEAEILDATAKGLDAQPEGDLVRRLMDGLLEAEKLGALVSPEYAALEKAFLIYSGYADWLPKDYIFQSLERAMMVRMLRDRPVGILELAKLGVRRVFGGRKAVHADVVAAYEKLVELEKAEGPASGGASSR